MKQNKNKAKKKGRKDEDNNRSLLDKHYLFLLFCNLDTIL